MDDIEKIIREDKEQHPNCGYSESLSKTCRTKDGKFVCDTIKSINRMCPNQRPVNIYSSATKSDDIGGDNSNRDSAFPNFLDPFQMFKEMDRNLGTGSRNSPKLNGEPQKPQSSEPNTSIEFRFGDGRFGVPSDEGGDGLFGILKRFGVPVPDDKVVKEDKKPVPRDGSKRDPPPGTSIGPPEDI